MYTSDTNKELAHKKQIRVFIGNRLNPLYGNFKVTSLSTHRWNIDFVSKAIDWYVHSLFLYTLFIKKGFVAVYGALILHVFLPQCTN